jgi:hypothetical protein
MGHYKENKKPHQPEVPDARFVILAEDGSQSIELRGLMNRPACEDRQEPANRNGKMSDALQCVVFCAETGMRPIAMR